MYRNHYGVPGRPKGKTTPANIEPATEAHLWGVVYKITRWDLVWLDAGEGVPGFRYRHLWVEAEDKKERWMRVVIYITDGKEIDGKPSLRYITLPRDGARAHGLPEHYLRFLDEVDHAE